ncbi:acyltransferase family protein [Enterobacter pseudoroggenkampii]|uniref:acyltransferase family protein n=1 Tax=Enterobacter pseudoroggenkampii TaxID=2996112 RepID=UPI0020037D9E|nr:acyltransferase [Enterobacter pseudoroggenkampii]MCK4227036.1 acyltransferase [Enterobacter asburiae]MCX8289610.1 acyltransferase [Enterobacter pseudoroggenkampii]
MEIKSLTGVRGVAAFYVVTFHLVERNFGGRIDDFLTNGYLAVDFFFILSGFIMSMVHNEFSTKGSGNYSYFMFKRFIRIYPVYIFLYVSSVILASVEHGITESPLTFLINGLLLQSLFGFNYIASSWSISTEMFAYLLFPAMLMTISKTKYIIPIVISALASLIYLSVSNEILAFSVNASGGLKSILRCLADYSLGVTSYVLFANGRVISNRISYALCLILAVLLVLRQVDVYIIALCAIIIPSLVDETNVVSRVLSIKPIHYLGQISYSLYLVHSLLINQLSFVFEGTQQWRIALIFIFSILISMFTYHCVEKPCRSYLSKYGKGFNNNI